jgi:hypothetical protein
MPRQRSLCRSIGFPGVEHDILRRGAEGDHHRQRRHPAELVEGSRNPIAAMASSSRNWVVQPAATTPKKRRRVAVHHRRPEKLKDIGLADQREKPIVFRSIFSTVIHACSVPEVSASGKPEANRGSAK